MKFKILVLHNFLDTIIFSASEPQTSDIRDFQNGKPRTFIRNEFTASETKKKFQGLQSFFELIVKTLKVIVPISLISPGKLIKL